MVKVVAIDAPAPRRSKRLGFLAGQITFPPNFDRMDEDEIAALFHGEE